jgi:hypothetical protein
MSPLRDAPDVQGGVGEFVLEPPAFGHPDRGA